MAIVFISAFIIMLASLAGVLFVLKSIGRWVERNLTYLATFAAGVFAIVVWDLFSESLGEETRVINIVGAALVGMVVLEFVSRTVPKAHHHHGREQSHQHTRIDARRMLLGDSVHNFVDGLLLVPAFLLGTVFGLTAALAVFLHELVQEISEFFVLKEAGYTTRSALFKNFVVSATILPGVLIGFFLSHTHEVAALLSAFAAGGFLYVIARDLVPNAIFSARKTGKARPHIFAALLGVALMLAVGLLLPETH